MDILQTLSADLAFDVRMSQTSFGGYAPAAPVLANRIYNKVQDTVKALLATVSPHFWMERATEYKGRTFHIGERRLVGAAYNAEMERIQEALRAAGYTTRLYRPGPKADHQSFSLYVTLDPKLGEAAVAAHLDYLRLLSEQEGVYLPSWAKDLITA